MRNVLLCGFSPASMAETAIKTIIDNKIAIKGWLGRVEIGDLVKEALPRTSFFSSPFSTQPYNKSGFEELDEIYRDNLNDLIFLIERDLQYPKEHNFFQISQLIIDQLIYANHILESVKPDLLLFSDIPHSSIMLSIYLIAKKRGIDINVLTTSIVPHIYEVLSSYEECNQFGAYSDIGSKQLTEKSASFINRLSSNYNVAKPSYMIAQERKYGSLFRRLNTIKAKVIKDNRKLSIVAISAFVKRNSLKKYYEEVVSKPFIANDTNYILFALHFQPERTTMPQGSLFAQQLLVIKMIAGLLPDSWKLIVKEHPSSFLIGPYPVRREEFYDSVAHIPNVQFVSTRTNTFQLIDGAKAVVTLTGTIGFESLIRMKPVLAFGYANFTGLEGAFFVKSYTDCKAALSAIINGEVKPDIEDIKRKITFLENADNSIVSDLNVDDDRVAYILSGKIQAKFIEKVLITGT